MTVPLLARCGFDLPRLTFAGWTALAACAALALAWLIGLEHPQWSAMTVWTASQPTRGHLLEKSFFRVAGTTSGTIAGVVLVLASNLHPALMVGGLALWVGLCAGIGNLQRGFVSYGTILAGVTAAMVALFDTAHPDRVLHLGADRLATVLTGVVVAMVVGLVFIPSVAASPLQARVRGMLADLMQALADHRGAPPPPGDTAHRLLSDMAAIEEMLDLHGAGSLRSRREARATRVLLGVTLPVLQWLRGAGTGLTAEMGRRLEAAALALRGDDPEAALEALQRAMAVAPSSDLSELLLPVAEALRTWSSGSMAPSAEAPPVVLHRDWIGAREAMTRAMVTIALFGAFWLVSGWSAGAFMLLGTSVMVSMFSTFDNPAHTMRFVFLGQCLGVLGALACRWLAWPLAGSEAGMIALAMPFILFGALLVGHQRTVTTSFDYNMVLLLMLQPAWPLTGSFEHSATIGLSILAAPLAAMLAYRFIYPTGLQRRIETLITMMLHDLADLAGDPKALGHRQRWRARLYHRMFRLVRLSERSGRANLQVLDSSLALLDLGHVAMRSHEMLEQAGMNAADRRPVAAVLARMRQVGVRSDLLGRALGRASRRLAGADADLFARAAAGLAAQPEFFRSRMTSLLVRMAVGWHAQRLGWWRSRTPSGHG